MMLLGIDMVLLGGCNGINRCIYGVAMVLLGG